MVKRTSPDELAYSKVTTSSRHRRRLTPRRLLGVAAVSLLIFALLAPTIFSHGPLVAWLVNRFGNLAGLNVQIAEFRMGWLSPIKCSGVVVRDPSGNEVISVGQITTQLSLLRVIKNPYDLKSVFVTRVKIPVDVQPATTSVEESLRPLLPDPAVPVEPPAESAPLQLAGIIHLDETSIVARDSVTGKQWELAINHAALPLDFSKAAEATVHARISELDGAGIWQLAETGELKLSARSIATDGTHVGPPPMQLTMDATLIPLGAFDLIKRRLPDLPIEKLAGAASIQATIDMQSMSMVRLAISSAQLDKVRLDAPALVGQSGATIEQLKLEGDVRLVNDRVVSDWLRLTTDFGFLRASGEVPLALPMPSIAQPYFPGTGCQLDGEVDLVRLMNVAPDLIPLKDQAQLNSGSAKIVLRHDFTDNPSSLRQFAANVTLGNLEARLQERTLRWDDALQATVSITPDAARGGVPQIAATCQAEFCHLTASGTLQEGSLAGDIDLNKLQQRLSDWIDLPTDSFAGTVQANLGWHPSGTDQIAARGELKTSALTIGLPGGKLHEPAWTGEIETLASLNSLQLKSIDQLSVKLSNEKETLIVQSQQPIDLSAPATANGRLQCEVVTELADCGERLATIFGTPLPVKMVGRLQVQSTLRGSPTNAVLERADYRIDQLMVEHSSAVIIQPAVQGQFEGRIDLADPMHPQIDQLLLQSESLALTARSEAIVGSADSQIAVAFRCDPERMLSALRSPATAVDPIANNGLLQTNSAATPAQLQPLVPVTCTAETTGNATLKITADAVGWNGGMSMKNVVVRSIETPAASNTRLVSTSPQPEVPALWTEPQVHMTSNGAYSLTDGSLKVDQINLQSEWVAYAANLSYASQGTESSLVSDGSVTYDAASAALKLKPYIGELVRIEGQYNTPVSIRWTSSPNAQHWSDGLAARTSLKWERAEIFGIPLGAAEVPMSVADNEAKTATEFAVSAGTLRWDVRSRLNEEPLIVRQSPQKMLENVAITEQMCRTWLKYVAPITADAASIQGRLTLEIERAEIYPLDSTRQNIAGRILIDNATVGPGPLSSQFIAIGKQIKAMRDGVASNPAQPATNDVWVVLPQQAIAFSVEDGKISHRDVRLRVGDVEVISNGTVGIDGSLQMTAAIPIQDAWIQSTPYLAPLKGQTINLPISGTLQQPRLDTNSLQSVTQQLISTAASQAVQKQVDRGINKLLGPLQEQMQPFQQQIQQLPQSLQNLPQLPMPQLPTMPQLPNLGIKGLGTP